MYRCLTCDIEFPKLQSLAAHQNKHSVKASIYNKNRKKRGNKCHIICAGCGEIHYTKNWKKVKFCSNSCHKDFLWKTESIPRIENGLSVNKNTLRKYLIEKHGPNCLLCGQIPFHNNKSLTMQIDHVDGDNENNLPNNIRLLCPNCHTQTETWG